VGLESNLGQMGRVGASAFSFEAAQSAFDTATRSRDKDSISSDASTAAIEARMEARPSPSASKRKVVTRSRARETKASSRATFVVSTFLPTGMVCAPHVSGQGKKKS